MKPKSRLVDEVAEYEMENGIRPKTKRKLPVNASEVAEKVRAKEREVRELEEWEMENGVRPKGKKRKAAAAVKSDEESDEENMSGARKAARGADELKVSRCSLM